jgi:hypothetical protein
MLCIGSDPAAFETAEDVAFRKRKPAQSDELDELEWYRSKSEK